MRSWCFDSQATTVGGETTYDREYGSTEIREVVGKLIGNGIYADPATNMQVTTNSGMSVKVQPGCCWIKGAFGAVDTAESLTLDASSGGRVDAIVARFDLALSYRSIRLAVMKGTEGSTEAPSLTRNNSVYNIQLAKVSVRAGATSILQSDITDTRYDNTVCGIVTGVIDQIDTSNLFAQYQASFNAFMAQLEDTLSGDVAGNLLNLINAHKNDKGNPHGVTKNQVGLEYVENVRQYSANNKPSKNDVGLGNLDNVRQYSSNNKPSRNDVGLGNVANERQYSANNPPPQTQPETKTINAIAYAPTPVVFSFKPSAVIANTHHETAKSVLLPKGASDPPGRSLYDNIEMEWSDAYSVNIMNNTSYACPVTLIAFR